MTYAHDEGSARNNYRLGRSADDPVSQSKVTLEVTNADVANRGWQWVTEQADGAHISVGRAFGYQNMGGGCYRAVSHRGHS